MISACLPTYAPPFCSLKNKNTSNGGSNSHYMGQNDGHANSHNHVTSIAAYRNGKPHPHIRLDDDEIELTAKQAKENRGTETDSMSQTSSDNRDGIMVKHHFNITSEKR